MRDIRKINWGCAPRVQAALSRLTLIPDSNDHRCRAVGVLDYGGGDDPALELVQCDSYVGHVVRCEHVSMHGPVALWRDDSTSSPSEFAARRKRTA